MCRDKLESNQNSIEEAGFNPKKVWAIANGAIGKGSASTLPPKLVDGSGTVISRDVALANHVNRFYMDKISKLRSTFDGSSSTTPTTAIEVDSPGSCGWEGRLWLCSLQAQAGPHRPHQHLLLCCADRHQRLLWPWGEKDGGGATGGGLPSFGQQDGGGEHCARDLEGDELHMSLSARSCAPLIWKEPGQLDQRARSAFPRSPNFNLRHMLGTSTSCPCSGQPTRWQMRKRLQRHWQHLLRSNLSSPTLLKPVN